ncbi:MAG TPA: peptidylprolyl isomerase [Clostridiales bacterium]|nr:peptidylprolyl isomerase [Clostridiales bacterium]
MGKQTAAPVTGDLIAVFHTTLGTVKVKLFPEEAPKTVENFTTHAKNGYYDGLIFHRVISDFMIQGGDPTGTGMGGESIWGHSFEDEFSPALHNLRGALCMANAGPNTNGSQFFIVQADTCPPQMLEQMEQLTDRGFPQECIEDYKTLGGTPWLDYKHTVFGQVFEGMDVVDAIATVPVGPADKPKEDVKIINLEIETR